MKSTLALGFFLAAASAAPTLKSLIQAEQFSNNGFVTLTQKAGEYGFNWTCPENSTIIVPPPITPPGSGNPNGTDFCNCNINMNNTGAGLPSLGQSEVSAYNTIASATVGTSIVTNPDNQQVLYSAQQVCACETKTNIKRRQAVKNNSFQFGGRIDVVEAALESTSSQSSAQSSGSAQRQATSVVNNQGGQGSLPTNGTCVSVCLE